MGGSLFVRISDNSHEPEEFQISKLEIEEGRVAKQEEIRPGAYQIGSLIGLSLEELSAWSRFNETILITHHEFFAGKYWRDFLKAEEIAALVGKHRMKELEDFRREG